MVPPGSPDHCSQSASSIREKNKIMEFLIIGAIIGMVLVSMGYGRRKRARPHISRRHARRDIHAINERQGGR